MFFKWFIVLFQICLITAFESEVFSSTKLNALYSIVAPGKLIANSDYLITIATNGGEKETAVAASINSEADDAKMQLQFTINPNETMVVSIKVGDLKRDANYALNITGTGGISFSQFSPLHLESQSVSIFIQTDKAMYKAGQKVLFRVVVVDQDLKPIGNKQVDIQIKDANSNVIKKYILKSSENGIISNELLLSDQPVLGEWTIIVTADEKKEEKKFTISEYVLPSFGVDIIIPPFIIKKTPKLVGSVKAMYTYGKLVKGEFTLTIRDHHLSYFNGTYSKRKRYELKSSIDGEYKFQISQGALVGDEKLYIDHIIDLSASVKDNLTGKHYNTTKSLRIFENKYKFELLKNTRYQINKTYVNFVKVSYQDDTPVENSDKKLVLKYGYGWDARNRKNTYEVVPLNGIAKIEMFIEDTNETEPDYIHPIYEEPMPYYPGYGLGIPQPLVDVNNVKNESNTSALSVPLNNSTTKNATKMEDTNSTSLNFGVEVDPIRSRFYRPSHRPIGHRPIDKSSISVTAVYENEESYLATIYQNDIKGGCSIDLKITNEIFNKVYKENEDIELQLVNDKEPLNDFFYEVMTRKGVVIAEKVMANDMHKKSFVIKVTKEFYPKANIVVHLFCDRKIVEKTLTINVEEVFDNKPIVSMSTNETNPSSNIGINIQAKPSSSVAILGYDQRMALLKSGNDIEKSNVFQSMEKQLGCNGFTGFSSCVENSFRFGTSRLNFDDSGLIHFTNVPSAVDIYPYPRHFLYSSANGMAGGPLAEEFYYEADSDYFINGNERVVERKTNKPSNNKAVTIRQNFPETWLFEIIKIDDNGVKAINRKIPDSITSWFITSFAINKENGFGLTDTKAKINVFRNFFIRLSLPYSVIRGETVSITVTAYNYFNKPEVAEIKMESNGEFDFVLAESEENEISFSRDLKTKTVTVPENNGISVSFLIKPKKIGYITIKVFALSNMDADGISEKLLVKPEGDTHYKNKAMLLDLKAGEIFKEKVDIEIPENLVPDSERISTTLIGDILGPTINNLDDLLRMPYGCGEQNMINFVPNIVILEYLTQAGKLNEKIKSKAIKHIESGYQRELTYEHDDGSYSAFGKSDQNGSTWLTAFVHKSFIQARKHINIDEKVTQRSLKFLLSKQNEDGSFREDGKLLDSRMKGATGSNSAALTAYIYIALLFSATPNTTEMKKTETFLLNHLKTTQSLYDISIITYALHLSNSSDKDFAFNKLMNMSKSTSGLIYWTQDDESMAATIEMTSYALMTLKLRDSTGQALPVLRYLVSKQNSNGGFSSTQDTVIAIQALSSLANKMSNKLTEIRIDVETEDEKKDLAINADNSFVLQELSLSPKARKATFVATGEGSAILQLSWQYNVMNNSAEPAFAIRYKIVEVTADSIIALKIFTKYLKGKESGMAVMEVSLPSGYKADMEALHDLKKSGVKRVETKNDHTVVVIYFNEITEKEALVNIVAERKVKVANLKSVPITVYEYYNNSQRATIFYQPNNSTVCDICDGDDCGKSCS